MTDDDAEKVIERLKYTKKEIAARNAQTIDDELAKVLSQCISDEIDNEILNRIRKEHQPWQTESTSQKDMKRAAGLSTYLHSADFIPILLEKFITSQNITCPKEDCLKVLNMALKD